MICSACSQALPADAFATDVRTGVPRSRCRECANAANAAYYKANRARIMDRNQRYRAEKPAVRRAHKLVQTAIGQGVIRRADACHDCGSKAFALEGHHDDYAKPLAVRWLCRPCHRALHRLLKHNELVGG